MHHHTNQVIANVTRDLRKRLAVCDYLLVYELTMCYKKSFYNTFLINNSVTGNYLNKTKLIYLSPVRCFITQNF